MIGIIDYGMGNLGSVRRKLDRIGAASVITDNLSDLSGCDRLILPGVGHFSRAVDELKKRKLWDFLNNEVLIKKKPILGICLGMQLMADSSGEGNERGFGWIAGEVVRFSVSDTYKFKVPHMGWNDCANVKDSSLLTGIAENALFYFVHSYHIVCSSPEDILTTTTYNYSFTSAIQKDNIFGVQFHPEKSHDAGELLLRNFVEL